MLVLVIASNDSSRPTVNRVVYTNLGLRQCIALATVEYWGARDHAEVAGYRCECQRQVE